LEGLKDATENKKNPQGKGFVESWGSRLGTREKMNEGHRMKTRSKKKKRKVLTWERRKNGRKGQKRVKGGGERHGSGKTAGGEPRKLKGRRVSKEVQKKRGNWKKRKGTTKYRGTRGKGWLRGGVKSWGPTRYARNIQKRTGCFSREETGGKKELKQRLVKDRE